MRVFGKSLLLSSLVLTLLLTLVGVVAAEGEDPPEDPPTLFEHPVVTVLGDYFGKEAGEEIAAHHEEGVGFGVLVKVYAIAAESQEACEGEAECGVTVDELLADLEAGKGLGELFKEYGKPAVLGVGHTKDKDNGPPDHAGPKEKTDPGPPDHAGPKNKVKEKDKGGPPSHAGPKQK